MTDPDRLFEIIDRFDGVDVVLYGDLVLDRFVLGTPKRISREAPVVILRHEGQRDVPGGAANALANLTALGVNALPVAAVGDDECGAALRDCLHELGVDLSRLLEIPGYRTPTKVRILGGGPSSLKHQVARYDIEDHLDDDPATRDRLMELVVDAAAGAHALAVSDYGYGTVRPSVVRAAVTGKRRPRWICVDSRYRIAEFEQVDGATPNLQELEAVADRPLLTDDDVADVTADLRRQLGARFVLTTRGNSGMTLVDDDGSAQHLPVFGTDEVADVTGAGDTVLAVLVAALAAGATPSEATRLANYGGGIVVMKLGTATVTRDELRDAIRRDHADGRR